jgi:hypothetical protein
MGNAAGRSLRTLAGCREAHAGAAGGGSRVHTYKQLLQPNIHALFRPVEAAVYSSKTGAESPQNVPARFRPLQLQLRGV